MLKRINLINLKNSAIEHTPLIMTQYRPHEEFVTICSSSVVCTQWFQENPSILLLEFYQNTFDLT